ncbi:MAG: tetratricopeptide repeat protein [Anaerolineae bacterium]|nr:tetratricopeptide repeat protein [Anaerolineae bacterium]
MATGQPFRRKEAVGKALDSATRVIDLLNEGARLLATQRPGEALTPLREALLLAPDNVSVAINLGGAYIMQRKYRQAAPILERAAELEPDNAMAWLNLAAAYLGRLELSTRATQDQAIAAFEKAAQIDPNLHNVHYNLGLIYRTAVRWRACAHFQRAVEIAPMTATPAIGCNCCSRAFPRSLRQLAMINSTASDHTLSRLTRSRLTAAQSVQRRAMTHPVG